MDDREYVQDEGDTVDLVVWEEYVSLAKWRIQEDWENWVNSVGYTD